MVARVNRHGLTDQQWSAIESLIPKPSHMGRPPRDAREMMDALMWILRTGAPWRDLPDWFGPWQTSYTRFGQWRDGGVLDRIVEKLLVLLADAEEIDWELWCIDGSSLRAARIDGSSIRAARCAAGGGKRGDRTSLRITR